MKPTDVLQRLGWALVDDCGTATNPHETLRFSSESHITTYESSLRYVSDLCCSFSCLGPMQPFLRCFVPPDAPTNQTVPAPHSPGGLWSVCFRRRQIVWAWWHVCWSPQFNGSTRSTRQAWLRPPPPSRPRCRLELAEQVYIQLTELNSGRRVREFMFKLWDVFPHVQMWFWLFKMFI